MPRETFRFRLLALCVCILVPLFAGAGCARVVGDIGYAPGHGYVVQVEKTKQSNFTKYYLYYVFETYEEAVAFINQRGANTQWPHIPGPKEVYSSRETREAYDNLGKLLVPPVPSAMQAVPDLPEPIPPMPQ